MTHYGQDSRCEITNQSSRKCWVCRICCGQFHLIFPWCVRQSVFSPNMNAAKEQNLQLGFGFDYITHRRRGCRSIPVHTVSINRYRSSANKAAGHFQRDVTLRSYWLHHASSPWNSKESGLQSRKVNATVDGYLSQQIHLICSADLSVESSSGRSNRSSLGPDRRRTHCETEACFTLTVVRVAHCTNQWTLQYHSLHNAH